MNFTVGLNKQKTEHILPPEKRVYITLETQEEINQLFALLNHVVIAKAIDLNNNAWRQLRLILPRSHSYERWHDKLCTVIGERD